MKKIHYILLTILTCIYSNVNAQKLVFNEKAPQLSIDEYIIGNEILKNKPSYILFFIPDHSENDQDVKKVAEFSEKYRGSVNFIIIAGGDKQKVKDYFKDKQASYIVVMDNKGKTFLDYGIKYIPASIMTDSRGYFIWQGKTSMLTDDLINKYNK